MAFRDLAERRSGAVLLVAVLAITACCQDPSPSPKGHRLRPATMFSHRMSGHFRVLHSAREWRRGEEVQDLSGPVLIRDSWQVSGVDIDSLQKTRQDIGWFSIANTASGTDTVLVLEGNLCRPDGTPLRHGFDGRRELTVIIPRRGRAADGAYASFNGPAHGEPYEFRNFEGTISVDEITGGTSGFLRLEGSFQQVPNSDRPYWYTHLALSLRSETPSAVIPLERYKALLSDNPREVVAELARRGGARGLPQRLFPSLFRRFDQVEGEKARTIFIQMCRQYMRNAPDTTLFYLNHRFEKFKEREVLLEMRNSWPVYSEQQDGQGLRYLEESGPSRGQELERLLSSREVRVLRTALREIWSGRPESAKTRSELTNTIGRLIDHPDPIVSSYSRAILREIGR